MSERVLLYNSVRVFGDEGATVTADAAKLRPRTLRIGIYGPGDELLSDRQEIDFDATSENARDRETKIQLVLSHEAENFNNKEVALRLEERVGATTHYQQYKSVNYTIRRSFTSDFD